MHRRHDGRGGAGYDVEAPGQAWENWKRQRCDYPKSPLEHRNNRPHNIAFKVLAAVSVLVLLGVCYREIFPYNVGDGDVADSIVESVVPGSRGDGEKSEAVDSFAVGTSHGEESVEQHNTVIEHVSVRNIDDTGLASEGAGAVAEARGPSTDGIASIPLPGASGIGTIHIQGHGAESTLSESADLTSADATKERVSAAGVVSSVPAISSGSGASESSVGAVHILGEQASHTEPPPVERGIQADMFAGAEEIPAKSAESSPQTASTTAPAHEGQSINMVGDGATLAVHAASSSAVGAIHMQETGEVHITKLEKSAPVDESSAETTPVTQQALVAEQAPSSTPESASGTSRVESAQSGVGEIRAEGASGAGDAVATAQPPTGAGAPSAIAVATSPMAQVTEAPRVVAAPLATAAAGMGAIHMESSSQASTSNVVDAPPLAADTMGTIKIESSATASSVSQAADLHHQPSIPSPANKLAEDAMFSGAEEIPPMTVVDVATASNVAQAQTTTKAISEAAPIDADKSPEGVGAVHVDSATHVESSIFQAATGSTALDNAMFSGVQEIPAQRFSSPGQGEGQSASTSSRPPKVVDGTATAAESAKDASEVGAIHFEAAIPSQTGPVHVESSVVNTIANGESAAVPVSLAISSTTQPLPKVTDDHVPFQETVAMLSTTLSHSNPTNSEGVGAIHAEGIGMIHASVPSVPEKAGASYQLSSSVGREGVPSLAGSTSAVTVVSETAREVHMEGGGASVQAVTASNPKASQESASLVGSAGVTVADVSARGEQDLLSNKFSSSESVASMVSSVHVAEVHAEVGAAPLINAAAPPSLETLPAGESGVTSQAGSAIGAASSFIGAQVHAEGAAT